ncbi:hypothetical protein LEP1GSC193_0466 [Leptospira alstonii serovar Pingchang str. 80-412]|uniref:Uncharacterized protein n=2 Tax=Leptospira alstonii TaxID=28452 RepID=M6CS64_9LEPT|nr:hypothetical protein LEP1GSC194_1432 [Leptospira alstonii serovar Sichuan str. 79601]EQA79473.1 hypothetical protein LEP1GSC193_0466 [Leptospira alstonii serovar Pingchang str. 80-412]
MFRIRSDWPEKHGDFFCFQKKLFPKIVVTAFSFYATIGRIHNLSR